MSDANVLIATVAEALSPARLDAAFRAGTARREPDGVWLSHAFLAEEIAWAERGRAALAALQASADDDSS